MTIRRRRFLQTAAGISAAALVGRTARPAQANELTIADLDAAAARPVLKKDLFDAPVVIDSIRLLKKGSEHFVHVRSKGGAEGIAVTNERAEYLYPIFHKLVAPYFVGKDARDLDEHLWEVYRFRSNYKLQGIALWCPVAWIEFALLDMLGRIANKPIGNLLGTIVRRDVRQRLEEFGPEAFLVFTQVHNIQYDVPPENVLAMRDEFLAHALGEIRR